MTNQLSIDRVLRDISAFLETQGAIQITMNSYLSTMAPATTTNEYAVTMTDADTEYSQALPADTKKITLSCRDGTAFRFAFTTGKVAAPTDPFQTIQANQTLHLDNLGLTDKTLYVGCAGALKVAEIIAWT